MTTLIIDEFINEFIQTIRFDKRIKIGSIKARFYVHNMPSGVFTFQILKQNTLIIEESFTCSDLRDSFNGTENFFHVNFPLFLNKNLVLDRGNYEFKIISDGYTFSQNSFFSWTKDFQGVFGGFNDENVEFTEYPYSFRIIEIRQREK
jgi:hypothetical protein